MLGNLKEFISVVQDGLSANNNLRQRFQEVHKVFKDKERVSNTSGINFGAGGKLLDTYQEQWAELHRNADINAKAADEVDRSILELHEVTKAQLKSATDLAANLVHLPAITASVAQCMDSLKNVQILLNTVEEDLVEFEDIVERSNMEKWKMDHHYHLSLYKEKKMSALEEIRCQLARDNAEQSYERERKHIIQLQAKREDSTVAFRNDVAKYLNDGCMPSSPAQTSVAEITLEQVQLDDDRTDLDNFLNS